MDGEEEEEEEAEAEEEEEEEAEEGLAGEAAEWDGPPGSNINSNSNSNGNNRSSVFSRRRAKRRGKCWRR